MGLKDEIQALPWQTTSRFLLPTLCLSLAQFPPTSPVRDSMATKQTASLILAVNTDRRPVNKVLILKLRQLVFYHFCISRHCIADLLKQKWPSVQRTLIVLVTFDTRALVSHWYRHHSIQCVNKISRLPSKKKALNQECMAHYAKSCVLNHSPTRFCQNSASNLKTKLRHQRGNTKIQFSSTQTMWSIYHAHTT